MAFKQTFNDLFMQFDDDFKSKTIIKDI